MPCAGFEVLTGMLTLGGLKDDYSVFSPLTGFGGRYGGLGLECRWRALWAIGVKCVSSRSTLLAFRWIWGGVGGFGWFRWIGWIGLPIYMQWSVSVVRWFAYIYARLLGV